MFIGDAATGAFAFRCPSLQIYWPSVRCVLNWLLDFPFRYFLMPKDEIVDGLKKRSEGCQKDIEALKTGQGKLEKELEEIKQNFQEALQTSLGSSQVPDAA